jgi:hypothetical protein
VDSGCAGFEELAGEVGCVLDTDGTALGRGSSLGEALCEGIGEGAAGHFDHAAGLVRIGDGDDSGDDGGGDSSVRHVGHEESVVLRLEEELGDGEVRDGELGGLVFAIADEIGGERVSLGVGGDAEGEVALVAEEVDEFSGVVKVTLGEWWSIGWGVAVEGEEVLDAIGLVFADESGDFVAGMADAGEVWEDGEVVNLAELVNDLGGAFAAGAAGAVSDRDEGRVERGKVLDGARELHVALGCTGRVELK